MLWVKEKPERAVTVAVSALIVPLFGLFACGSHPTEDTGNPDASTDMVADAFADGGRVLDAYADANGDASTDGDIAQDAYADASTDGDRVPDADTEMVVEHVATTTGVDWSLPVGVRPKDSSGALYMDRWSDREVVRFAGATLSWAQLNPADGVYDFSALDGLLTEATTRGTPLVIRLKCHVVARATSGSWGGPELPYVPQWVLDLHSPAEFYTLGDQDSASSIRVAAPWNAGLQQELAAFIEALGLNGYLDNPALRGVYITGFSSSYGEEFWLHRAYLPQAQAAGMTEALIRQTYQDRIDWWVAAAGTNAHKLIWIDFGEIQNAGYHLDDLDDYAINRGVGWRHGGPDAYHSPFPSEVEQSYEPATGYINTDWSYPLRDGLRYFGGEIEVVPRQLVPSITEAEQTHLTESAIMRTAQIGMNYAWTSPQFIDYSPAMFEWWTLVAGKSAPESPDAVCWLRQDSMRLAGTDYDWNNFELFLKQRDGDGAQTRPVLPISRPPSLFWQDVPGAHFDYSARATEVGLGNRAMLFQLDPDYLASLAPPYQIKVVFYDDSSSHWVLEVPAGSAYATSVVVQGRAETTWKTATFTIHALPDNSSSPSGCDFRIRVLNDADLTVKYVRVLR